MSRLPAALAREIEELGRFQIRHTAAVDQVVLTARVRGVPVVLYLPSRIDFRRPNMAVKIGTIEKARALGVEIFDLTDCLREGMDEATLFVTGGVHYSGEGNRRFARCLAGALPESVATRAP